VLENFKTLFCFIFLNLTHLSCFRSLIEKSKDKLELVIKRTGGDKNPGRPAAANPHAGFNGDLPAKHNYAPQNLYVQPPVNGVDEKNNLARAIYSSSTMAGPDPIVDSPLAAPPRPPLPQDDGTSLSRDSARY
jgi:hypothetical protein